MRSEALRSLRHRDYRLYFFGQLVSMGGTWMQQTALSWLVYRLTGSGATLGLVAAAGQAPSLVLGLVGGSVADRFDRRRLLIVTQCLSLAQAAALAALATWGSPRPLALAGLAAFLGVVNVFDMPARQAFVAGLVPREDMGNAIALSGILLNASRLVGPAIAGLVIARAGEAACFWLNAASYLAVLAGLLYIRPGKAPEHEGPDGGELARIKEGLRYAFADPERRAVLVLLTAVSVTGVPLFSLMPAFTEGVLGAGPRGLGLYTSAFAVGALAGSYFLAARTSRGGARLVGGAAAAFGAGVMALAVLRSPAAVGSALALAGWGMMSCFSGSNILLQSLSSDAMRGRVMSLFSMTFMAGAPIGTLAAGWACDAWGVAAAFACTGLLCAGSGLALVVWERRKA